MLLGEGSGLAVVMFESLQDVLELLPTDELGEEMSSAMVQAQHLILQTNSCWFVIVRFY